MNKIRTGPFQGNVVRIIGLLTYMSFASWRVFFYPFLKETGLSVTQIGVIAGLMQFSIILIPIWGYIADKKGIKFVFIISLVALCIMVPGYMFNEGFIYFLILSSIISIIILIPGAIGDSLFLEYVHTYKRLSYGKIRLWGSVGWSVAALGTGFIVKSQGSLVIFPIAVILMIITVIFTYIFYQPRKVSEKNKEHPVVLSEFITLLKQEKQVVALLIFIILLGVFTSPLNLFLNMYYDEIGAGREYLGIAFALQSLPELPLFFYGQFFIKRFGARQIIVFSMLVAGLRLLAYSLTADPVIAISIGVFQGITLALFMVGVVEYMHSIVPHRWKATAQSLLYCSYNGFGFTMGNLLTGYLSDKISVRGTMAINGMVLFVLVVAGGILLKKLQKQKATCGVISSK